LITLLIIVILYGGLDMYLCLCKGLTESDVQRVCERVQVNPDTMVSALGLDDEDCCGRCARNIEEFVTLSTKV
jgi:bacterioferritin-associated ferredoxin